MIRQSILIQYGFDHVIHSSIVISFIERSVFKFCCDIISVHFYCFCFTSLIVLIIFKPIIMNDCWNSSYSYFL